MNWIKQPLCRVALAMVVQLVAIQSGFAQQWHSPDSLPFFRGNDAQDRAVLEMNANVQCMSNLHRLAIGMRMYSGEHNDQYPVDWQSCQMYLDGPSLLVCPKSAYSYGETNWAGFDFGQASYTLLPVKYWEWEKQAIVCKYHGNWANPDGTCFQARPYPQFPVAAKGKLQLPGPTRRAALKHSQIYRCINNLKQIGTAIRVYAGDNGDHFPTNFASIEAYLFSVPEVLYCPADDTTERPTNFAQVDYSKISYTMDQVSWQDDLTKPNVTCRYHGNILQVDGATREGTNAMWYPGVIFGHPISQTVVPGATAVLRVLTAPQAGAATFQWRKQQPFDAAGGPFTNTVIISGATNASLLLTNCSPADTGYYDVVATLPSGDHEVSEMAYLAIEQLADLPQDLDAQLCSNNLRQIVFAARMLRDGQPFPTNKAEYAMGLGWPMSLYCPSDSLRSPPADWDSVGLGATSYDIKAGVNVGIGSNVFAVCKVHHYYVQADGLVVLPETLRISGLTCSGETNHLMWTGGMPPYEVQVTTDLAARPWTTLQSGVAENSIQLPSTNGTMFYRVLWTSP